MCDLGPTASLWASVSFSITTLQQFFFDLFGGLKEIRDGKPHAVYPIPSIFLT